MQEFWKGKPAFTLAELLIALAILGVIATFTIPKVLASQTSAKYKAIGKEAAAMVSQALEVYKSEHTLDQNTRFGDLTPYMNYVKVDTTSIVDYVPTETTRDCNIHRCLKLHSGAILWYWDLDVPFNGVTTTHALNYFVDPDGVSTSSTESPGKAAQFFLYINGRVSSRGNINNPTFADNTGYSPDPSFEPDWFSWN